MISFPRKKPPITPQYSPYSFTNGDAQHLTYSHPGKHIWVKKELQAPWNCINCCTTPCAVDVACTETIPPNPFGKLDNSWDMTDVGEGSFSDPNP